MRAYESYRGVARKHQQRKTAPCTVRANKTVTTTRVRGRVQRIRHSFLNITHSPRRLNALRLRETLERRSPMTKRSWRSRRRRSATGYGYGPTPFLIAQSRTPVENDEEPTVDTAYDDARTTPRQHAITHTHTHVQRTGTPQRTMILCER